jgi:hypothetical protein
MRWTASAVALSVNVMDGLDTTIVNIAGPSIRLRLCGRVSTVQWQSVGYTLATQVRQLATTVGTALLRTGPDGRLTLTAYGQLSARDIRPALQLLAQSRKAGTTITERYPERSSGPFTYQATSQGHGKVAFMQLEVV